MLKISNIEGRIKNKKIKKIVTIFMLACIMVSSTGIGMAASGTAAKEKEKTEEYVIVAEEGVVDNLLRHNDTAKKLEETPSDEANIVARLTESERRELIEKNDDLYVEKNISFSGARCKGGKRRKCTNENWNMKMIDADKFSLEKKTNGRKVKVAVVDSGVEFSDKFNVVKHIDYVGDGVEVFYEDMTGHGTGVSSIISEINPNVELYSVRILDADNKAKLSSVIEALHWCIENKMDIINMSFGTRTNSPLLKKNVSDAHKAGILMIAAAGNEDAAYVEYPAAYPEVMAIGSVNSQGSVAENSAKGKGIELLAPGEDVETAGLFAGRIVESGTSLAAPHVTGVASILLEKNNDKSPDKVRQCVVKSSKKICDDGVSYGVLDTDAAIELQAEAADIPLEQIEYRNNDEVETFDMSDMVQARWSQNDHKAKVDTAKGIAGGLSATDVAIVKKGVVAQDNYLIYRDSDANTHKYKSLHGYNNYVNAYAYIMGMALKCKSSGFATARGISFPSVYESEKSDCTNIKNAITESMIKKALAGTAYNKRNAALILMGMAMHVVGDTYAHRAYIKKANANYWVHIAHAGGAADNTSQTSERYIATGYAMGEVLAIWNGNCNPSFEEYDLIGVYNHSSKFRLICLCDYSYRAQNGISYSYYEQNLKNLNCNYDSKNNVGWAT